MKRIVTIKLSRAEADAMLVIGNLGIADAHDAGDDESLTTADMADVVLNRIGAAYSETWPEADNVVP